MSMSSALASTAVLVLMVGAIMALVGFATPNWVVYKQGSDGQAGYYNQHYGLWTRCIQKDAGSKSCDSTASLDDNEDWYVASQAVAALGLFTALLAFCLLLVWVCTDRMSQWVKVTTISMDIVACVLLGTACLLFGMDGQDDLKASLGTLNLVGLNLDEVKFGWSFFLVIAGAALILLSAVFLVPVGPSYRGRRRHGVHHYNNHYDQYPAYMFPQPAQQPAYTFGNTWGNPYTLQQKVQPQMVFVDPYRTMQVQPAYKSYM